jgi:uncharacterized protein YlxW (UPF0749 family)
VRPYSVAAAGILVVAGALFAASAVASGGEDLRTERVTALRDLVRQQAAQTSELADEVARLTADVDARAAGAAGSPVSGSGLSVTLDDAPVESRDLDVLPDDLVVHQQDVQAVVNALWRGGATAMQIMDQRVIATSAVRCVGSTLILQGRVYSPPFTITAVGDPQQLRSALDADPRVQTYRSWVELVGLGYVVEEIPEVTVPAYEGALDISRAQTVQG